VAFVNHYYLYRFLAEELQEWSRRLGQGALLTALPDRLSGHRLAGRAQDNAQIANYMAESDQMGYLWKQGFFEGADPR